MSPGPVDSSGALEIRQNKENSNHHTPNHCEHNGRSVTSTLSEVITEPNISMRHRL